jgi:hypothetical protein
MGSAGVGGKSPLEFLGLRTGGNPSRTERLENRAFVVGINAGLMEGKKGRPDRDSAVYCQSRFSINFHVNRIILGPLGASVNAGSVTLSSVRTPFRTAVVALIALAIAAFSFLYRFNTLGGPLGGFDNDHFPQLVRAMAMLDGERPLRDFSDAELRALWPAPTYSTSALAQTMLGRSLRSEALLTVGLLSIGAAALFLVSTRFAGAVIPALIATMLTVTLRPALYNYPKIVLYTLAIAAMLGYSRQPTTRRLVMLGLVVAIAALFRHDHGVYLGIASLALVWLLHGRAAWRPASVFAVTCAAVVLPGLVLAQIDRGVVRYFREALALSRQEAGRTTNSTVHFTIDPSQPLLRHLDSAGPPLPRIAVRWGNTLTPEMRVRAEADLQLLDPVRRTDASNWSYALDNTSRTHLAAIVSDARVVDTDGVDRTRFVLTTPPPAPPGWTADLARWRIAPGVFRSENAASWLYEVAWGVVLCASLCALRPSLYEAMAASDVSLPAFRATCLLAGIMLIVLLRNPNASRLADVSVPVTILGSWLLGGIPRAMHGRTARLLAIVALTVLLLTSAAAIFVLGDVLHQFQVANFENGARARRQTREVWATLGALPSSLNGIDEGLQRAASYLRRCTRPTDRLFLGDNLPELFYFAQRSFAAGQVAYFSGFYAAPDQQREAIDRWRHEVVPIALTQPDTQFADEFATDYPLLAQYLRERYRKVGQLSVKQGRVVDVWVEGTQQLPLDRETGLPCVAND